MPVFFHIENIRFQFTKRREYKKWINKVIHDHGYDPGDVNIIFTSNDYLLEVNKEYLNHNYFTDVITFNYNEEKLISGDIFVSVEQVQINSEEYNSSFQRELARVLIHGVLHLLGLNDTNEEERKIIRKEEDRALSLLNIVE